MVSAEPSKRCTVCDETRPLDEFAVDRHPNRAGVGARKSACLSCDAARAAAYRAANLEGERTRQAEYQRRRRSATRTEIPNG